MSYSEEDLAVVDNCNDSLFVFEPPSGLAVDDELVTTGFENVNFTVKTFGSNESNSSESTRFTDLNDIQLSDEFEDSYLSLVNNKINRLEGRAINETVSEKKDSGHKDLSEMDSILGDAWIAEFDFPVDLALFKKILTNSVYAVCPDIGKIDYESPYRFSIPHRSDEGNYRSNMDYFTTPETTSNKYFTPGQSNLDVINSTDKRKDIHKSNDTNVPMFTPTKRKTHATSKGKVAKSSSNRSAATSSSTSRLYNDLESEKAHIEEEEYESPKSRHTSQTKPKVPTNSDGVLYFKTEQFNNILTNCPFLSSHSVTNSEIANKKAALIIDKLTKEAGASNFQSSDDKPGVSESDNITNELAEGASQSVELLDSADKPSDKPKTAKKRSKRRARRFYTTTPRYLKGRSRHSRRQAFLQKLNVLVDRITSKFINIKKDEIVCDEFYRTIPDATEYVAGTFGWKYDPYYFNCQARTRGHGLYLSCGGFSTPRELENSLRNPFKIPELATDRISHREIVKRMLQGY